MIFCDFCGKGPFSTSSGLNKHISHSANCIKAASQKWESYSTNIWDNVPGPSNIEPQPPISPPILENEIVDMPDITLEEDLQEVDLELPTLPETQPAQPQPFRATVDDSEDEDEESVYYVEEFPMNLGAGAVLGEEVPFFEKIRLGQVKNGTSQWAPFKDQDEWKLAEWLIGNIGQKQTDAFLNLNIVRPPRER